LRRIRLDAARLQSAEPLATLWSETLLDEEIELMERAQAVSHAIIADMFSNKVATPGFTTTDDLRWYYWQRAADLGLGVSFSPFVTIRGRHPKDAEKFGKDDKVIRPGDLVHCDVGVKYMRYNSDAQEMAYVLLKLGREEEAKISLSVAIDLERPLNPIKPNPFLFQLVAKSIYPLLAGAQEKREKEVSLINI
jgi:hypothetical protein